MDKYDENSQNILTSLGFRGEGKTQVIISLNSHQPLIDWFIILRILFFFFFLDFPNEVSTAKLAQEPLLPVPPAANNRRALRDIRNLVADRRPWPSATAAGITKRGVEQTIKHGANSHAHTGRPITRFRSSSSFRHRQEINYFVSFLFTLSFLILGDLLLLWNSKILAMTEEATRILWTLCLLSQSTLMTTSPWPTKKSKITAISLFQWLKKSNKWYINNEWYQVS